MKTLLAFATTLIFALSAWAHGGGAQPAVRADIAPRAVAQSEEFELVAAALVAWRRRKTR